MLSRCKCHAAPVQPLLLTPPPPPPPPLNSMPRSHCKRISSVKIPTLLKINSGNTKTSFFRLRDFHLLSLIGPLWTLTCCYVPNPCPGTFGPYGLKPSSIVTYCLSCFLNLLVYMLHACKSRTHFFTEEFQDMRIKIFF